MFRHQINLTPIFHIFLKIYWKLLSSFFIILNFFSYPHKYIENFSYVFKYKILNFTLISKNNSNCHNPNSTTKQPQLNSTELGLTWLWLCTPAHHHHPTKSLLPSQVNFWVRIIFCELRWVGVGGGGFGWEGGLG